MTAQAPALLAKQLEDNHGSRRSPPVRHTRGSLPPATSPTQIANTVVARFGGADIVVNNAGGSQPVDASSPEDIWESAYALNFTAIRRLTDALLPGMKARHWGTSSSLSAGTAGAHQRYVRCEVGRDLLGKGPVARGGQLRHHGQRRLSRAHQQRADHAGLYSAPDVKAETLKEIPLGYYGEPGDVAALVAFLCSARGPLPHGSAHRCGRRPQPRSVVTGDRPRQAPEPHAAGPGVVLNSERLPRPARTLRLVCVRLRGSEEETENDDRPATWFPAGRPLDAGVFRR